MELDFRIKKLAAGLSSREAAEAQVHPGDANASRSETDEFAGTVEAMFLMAAVDGVIADEEIEKLAEGIQHMAGNEGPDDATLMRWLQELHAQLEADGWSRRLDAAAGKLTSEAARASAFRMAAAVAMVDDHVAHAEAAAIDALAAALRIGDDEATRMLREVQHELFG